MALDLKLYERFHSGPSHAQKIYEASHDLFHILHLRSRSPWKGRKLVYRPCKILKARQIFELTPSEKEGVKLSLEFSFT